MKKFVFKAHKKSWENMSYIFFLHINILTRYYQKDKEKQRKPRKSYQNLSEKEKDKNRQYAPE